MSDDEKKVDKIISEVEEPNFEDESKDSVAGKYPRNGKMFLVGFLISSISLPILSWIVIALTDGEGLILILSFAVLLFLVCGGLLLKKDPKNVWYIDGFLVGLVFAPLIFFGSCLAMFAGSSW